MIAEHTTVRDMPDGSKLKLVSFFISPDGKYWSNIPSETGTLLTGTAVELENERTLWASLEPKP